MAKGFVLGLLTALILLAIGGYLFVTTGALPAGQDVTPSRLEKWAAHTSLRATVRREARTLSSPLQPNEENFTAGIALYRTHCQACHGGPDAIASSIAKGLSPAGPQLAKDGVEDDPEGVIYWKVAHGIRFTGMPAFRKSLDERELWKVTLFLKHMDALPPAPRQAWLDAKADPRRPAPSPKVSGELQANEGGADMKGFVKDIESLAVKNAEFRRVLYTAKHSQLVVMALKPKEEIGAEVHKLDQFFRVEEGSGEAVLDGVRTAIHAGFAVVVPAGTKHNIINTGTVPMKLYTLYSPPNHRDGVVHHTRADAEADNEHFDGRTTE